MCVLIPKKSQHVGNKFELKSVFYDHFEAFLAHIEPKEN